MKAKYGVHFYLAGGAAALALSTSVSAHAATVPSNLVAWWDSTLHTENVAYMEDGGEIYVVSYGQIKFKGEGVGWYEAMNPYYTQLNLIPLPGANWTAYFDGTAAHIYALEGDYNLHEWYINANGGGEDNMNASDTNLTGVAGGSQPMFYNYASYLSGSRLAPIGGSRTTHVLAGVSDASTLAGVYDGNQHVYYVGSDLLLHESYYNGRWWDHVLPTGDATAPNAYGGKGLTATSDYGAQHIFYSDFTGNLEELWLAAQWNSQSDTQEARLQKSTSPAGYLTSANDGLLHVFGAWTQGAGTLQELYQVNGIWQSGPKGIPDFDTSCPTSSLWDGSVLHVFYVGTDNHVHEEYRSGGIWYQNDLTAVAGGPAAGQGANGRSPIASIWDGTFEHAYYVGNDAHVHELYHSNTTGWVVSDLNVVAAINGAVPPAAAF